MFCNRCGKVNADDSNFCVHCGSCLNQPQPTDNNIAPVHLKQEIFLVFYKANIKMQQEALELQQQQLIEQQRQYASMDKCSRCGSTSLSGNKKGYGIGKGVIGGLAGVAEFSTAHCIG